MMLSRIKKLYGTYTALLVTLLILFFHPLFRIFLGDRLFFDLIISIIFVVGIVSVHFQERQRIAAWILGFCALASQWVEHIFFESVEIAIVSNSLTAVFLLFACIVIIVHILSTRSVTADVLTGAVCAYLLIGMAFACLFACVELAIPQSFKLPDVDRLTTDVPSFVYYSFVTLTTLGFGDATPVNPVARTFTVLEAVIGQMFIAILIASLVGKRLSMAYQENSAESNPQDN